MTNKKKNTDDAALEVVQPIVEMKKKDHIIGNEKMMRDKKAEVVAIQEKLRKRLNTRGPAKFDSPEEMALLIEDYFDDCVKYELFPTKRGLALALGTTYGSLWDWESGKRGQDYSDVMKKASEYLAEFDDQLALAGIENPVLYIFRSKNYHGLTDKQEMVLTPNSPLGNADTPEKVARKYLEGIGEEVETEE